MANEKSNSNSIGSLTYKLKIPLIQGDEIIEELSFRKPKLKHMKFLDSAKGNFDLMAKIIEKLCDIRPGLIDELDPADFADIGNIIQGFFPKPQET